MDKNERLIMLTGQLELSFAEAPVARPEACRQARQRRIRWWFNRMRRMVDLACNLPSSPPPRPEQTYLNVFGASKSRFTSVAGL
jgi:hypothetical protein